MKFYLEFDNFTVDNRISENKSSEIKEENMKMFKNLTLLLMLFSLTAFFWGCSDDSTSNELVQGDPNDPNFLFISSFLNVETVQSGLTMLDLSTDLIDSIPDILPKTGPVFKSSDFETINIVNYRFRDYWHVFEVIVSAAGEFDDGVDSVFFSGIDSIRFENAAGPMELPDSLTTKIMLRYHFDIEAYAPEGMIDVGNHGSLDLTGEFEGDFEINGFTSDSISVDAVDSITTIDLAVTTNQTYTDLFIDSYMQEKDACPNAGSIGVVNSIDLDMTITGDSPQTVAIHGIWNANFDFHNDRTVTITYSDGTSEWVTTEDCSGEGATKRNWNVVAKLLNK